MLLLQQMVFGRDEDSDELRGHYWSLLHRIGMAGRSVADRPKVIGVTSCQSGEGVSTIAATLATVAASYGQGSVLLVDANLNRPAAHRFLGVKLVPGLAEALADRSQPPAIQPSPVVNLSVLAAGDHEKCPARAVSASSFVEFLQSFQDSFALVVVDMPPVDRVGMAVQLAESLDGVLLVVEAERVRSDEIRRKKGLLTQANARLLGVVFNKQRRHVPAGLDRWM